jgi:hypothetical protein
LGDLRFFLIEKAGFSMIFQLRKPKAVDMTAVTAPVNQGEVSGNKYTKVFWIGQA